LEILTPTEKTLYEYIKKSGEVMTTNLPPKMTGALPMLIKKGFVEIYKKQTEPWSKKKKRFVRIKSS